MPNPNGPMTPSNPFQDSRIGKIITSMRPPAKVSVTEETTAASEMITKEELNQQVLRLRALIARVGIFQSLEIPDIDTPISSSINGLIDSDLLSDLKTEFSPDLIEAREIGTTINDIKKLLENSAIIEAYELLFNIIHAQIQKIKQLLTLYKSGKLKPQEKVALVRQASRILSNLEAWCDDEIQNIHNQVVREGRGYRPSDEQIIRKLNTYKNKCRTELERLIKNDNAAQISLRTDEIALNRATLKRNIPIEVKNRSRGLAVDGYIVTSDRAEIIFGSEKEPSKSILSALRNRQNVELFGPTGTGKTKLAEYAARVYSGKDPIVLGGSNGTSRYDFLGKPVGLNTRDEGILIKCLKEGRVMIIDEDNRIDPSVLAIVKYALGFKFGQKYIHPETSEEIIVKAGFGIIVTRNERGKNHKDRFVLPHEYRREFLGSFEIGYFTKEDMYDKFLVPKLTLEDGSMNLSEEEVGGDYNKSVRSPLLSLVVAAEEIQKLYTKGDLNGGVFESGFLIEFFDDWQELHLRTNCTFLQYIETRLIEFLHKGIDPNAKKLIITELIKQGFFKDKTESNFKPKEGESPVTQVELDKLFKSTNSVFNINPKSPKLSRNAVALLDPFGNRKIQRHEHPLKVKINALRASYTDFCLKNNIVPVPFDSFSFTDQKEVLIASLRKNSTNPLVIGILDAINSQDDGQVIDEIMTILGIIN